MQNSRRTSYESIDVLASFIFGILLGIPVYFFIFKRGLISLAQGAEFAAIAAIGGGIVSVLMLLSFRALLKRVFGKESPSAAVVYQDITASANAARDGNYNSAKVHADQAIAGGLGLYTWLTGRQWLTSLFLGSIALFAGSASTYILFQQNALIKAQTSILTKQEKVLQNQSNFMRDSVLNQDAVRYVPIYSQLTSVLDEILLESQQRKGLSPHHLVPLSPQLSARVVTLTRTFRPYWYYDSFAGYDRQPARKSTGTTATVIDSPPMVFLSPERGMILKSILENKVTLDRPDVADFSYSDMRGVSLLGTTIKGERASNFANFGTCEASDSITMQQKDKGETPKGSMYLLGLSSFNLDHSDFSNSFLNGVLIHDDQGTLKFAKSTLINTTIYAPISIDLSNSTIFSLTLFAATSAPPMMLIAKNAIFYRDLCFPSGDLHDYTAGYQIRSGGIDIGKDTLIIKSTHGLYLLKNSNFSGTFISKNHSKHGLFSFINQQKQIYAAEGNPLDDDTYILGDRRCFHRLGTENETGELQKFLPIYNIEKCI